jgi:hypothetical protein
MKFVCVNDRAPTKQSSCGLCREPIGRGYLREVGTGLFYCNHDCYVDHRESAADAFANLRTFVSLPRVISTESAIRSRWTAEKQHSFFRNRRMATVVTVRRTDVHYSSSDWESSGDRE